MNIVFFEVEDWMEDYISPYFKDHSLVFTDQPLTEKNAVNYQEADIISVFVFSKVTLPVMDQLSQLKLIAARSTGYDHIDVKAAKQKNIQVTNVPSYGSVTVAEHTWALILALSRRIFESYDRTEAANFSTIGLRGFDLTNKTLGLIGLGSIGQHVATMSKGFNLKLRVFTRTKDEDFARQFEDFVYVDRVEDVYSHADIISFHVPLIPATQHILNQDNYHSLKAGSIIINTARGGLIQTEALIKALKEKLIRGAAIDVLESEQLMKPSEDASLPPDPKLAEAYMNHILIGMDNVLITPHNAFNSDESIRRLIDGNLDSIKSYINNPDSTQNQV